MEGISATQRPFESRKLSEDLPDRVIFASVRDRLVRELEDIDRLLQVVGPVWVQRNRTWVRLTNENRDVFKQDLQDSMTVAGCLAKISLLTLHRLRN